MPGGGVNLYLNLSVFVFPNKHEKGGTDGIQISGMSIPEIVFEKFGNFHLKEKMLYFLFNKVLGGQVKNISRKGGAKRLWIWKPFSLLYLRYSLH